jgi:large subunit ribosomal protein L23
MSKTLILKPRLSEQTYTMAQQGRVYVFDVPGSANKHLVARAVAEQFEVKVETVNIANVKGKTKRTLSVTGRRRGGIGSRNDSKKAYVKLVEGFSLPVFAAIEEAEEKEQATQEKVDKAATKQAEKETKETKPTRRGLHLRRKSEEEK